MSQAFVAIRHWKGVVFISSTYSPGPGTYVNKEPIFTCQIDEAEKIGCFVFEALAAFREGGQVPDWDRYQSSLLKASGVSAKEFKRGLKECSVTKAENGFIVSSELGAIEVSETEGVR